MNLLTKEQAVARYGAIVNGRWGNSGKWMTNAAVPVGITLKYAGKAVKSISCNRDMAPALERAFQLILDRHLAGDLRDYGGCFEVRAVRDSSAANWSWHSYGLALDINPAENTLGGTSHQDPLLVQCFKDAGFFWGGDYHDRKDAMHFQWGLG